MIPATFVARPGARNVGTTRADASKAPTRAEFLDAEDPGYDVHVAQAGDVILTPRQPGGEPLPPGQQALLDQQHAVFNFIAAERAELLREGEMLREMATEQRKLDDECLKKLIAMI